MEHSAAWCLRLGDGSHSFLLDHCLVRSCAQPFILVCRHFRAGECTGMNALSRMQETSRESHLSCGAQQRAIRTSVGHYFFKKKSRATQVMFSPPLIKIIYVDGKSSSSPKRLIVSVTSWSCASKYYVCLMTQSCLTLCDVIGCMYVACQAPLSIEFSRQEY